MKATVNVLINCLRLLPGIMLVSSSCTPKQDNRPNLLFVFPDQLSGSAPGFMGLEPAITQYLNDFARESLVLTSAASN